MSGKRVLVVGAGPVAARRVDSLCAEGARVTVVAPQAVPDISARTDLRWHRRQWLPDDLDGMWLVQACAAKHVNARILSEAEQRGIWCIDASDAQQSPTEPSRSPGLLFSSGGGSGGSGDRTGASGSARRGPTAQPRGMIDACESCVPESR